MDEERSSKELFLLQHEQDQVKAAALAISQAKLASAAQAASARLILAAILKTQEQASRKAALLTEDSKAHASSIIRGTCLSEGLVDIQYPSR